MPGVVDVPSGELLQQLHRAAGDADVHQRLGVRGRNRQPRNDRQAERDEPIELDTVLAEIGFVETAGAALAVRDEALRRGCHPIIDQPAMVRSSLQYGARMAFLSSLPIALRIRSSRNS